MMDQSWRCRFCGNKNAITSDACSECGRPRFSTASAAVDALPLGSAEAIKRDSEPALASIFRILGVLEMVGGIVLCIVLWPGKPESGYAWTESAYVPSITWVAAGFVFCFLFFAVAEGLAYLNDLKKQTHRIEGLLRAARGGDPGGSPNRDPAI